MGLQPEICPVFHIYLCVLLEGSTNQTYLLLLGTNRKKNIIVKPLFSLFYLEFNINLTIDKQFNFLINRIICTWTLNNPKLNVYPKIVTIKS